MLPRGRRRLRVAPSFGWWLAVLGSAANAALLL